MTYLTPTSKSARISPMPILSQYSNVATWAVCADPMPRTPWSLSLTIPRASTTINVGGKMILPPLDQRVEGFDAGIVIRMGKM